MDFKKVNYAVTITPNKKDRVYYQEDIDLVVAQLLKVDHISILFKPAYEMKKDRTLHAHLAIIGPVGLRYTSLQHKGFQVYVKPMYNGNRWLNYLSKCQKCPQEQEELLLSHFYHHNYMIQPAPPT